MQGKNWDIFCRVVDNFGDIGFCWRLARQLVIEHDLSVRLWVDDLVSMQCICPGLNQALADQSLSGVTIRQWPAPFPPTDPADVVIEAFACNLPETYISAMATRSKQPVWINLEYLSAENWTRSCHELASPHPRLPLTKYFFFPGFTPGTGGLLRESALIQQRVAWQANPNRIWQHFDLPQAGRDEITISMFCYENSALPGLLHCWATGSTKVRCIIPEGKALAQACDYLKRGNLTPGTVCQDGNLSVYALPFLNQENYDRLLWSSDLNFVRGEDSFVRAQWAGRPFVWQIYPQGNDTHHIKLDAFLSMICTGLEEQSKMAFRQLWLSWNRITQPNPAQVWPDYIRHRKNIETNAANWTTGLEKLPDLASQLVQFCNNLL